jgi:hypothetical protein
VLKAKSILLQDSYLRDFNRFDLLNDLFILIMASQFAFWELDYISNLTWLAHIQKRDNETILEFHIRFLKTCLGIHPSLRPSRDSALKISIGGFGPRFGFFLMKEQLENLRTAHILAK